MPKLLPPRLQLPWDVLHIVAENSDADTLAMLGRVSLDFLAASTPYLYGHVEVRSIKQLAALFCKRSILQETLSKPSRINSLLELSQIRTLSLDLANSPSSSFRPRPDHRTLSLDRIPLSTPIPLHTVHFSVAFAQASELPFVHQLLPYLNPLHLVYRVRGVREGSGMWWMIMGCHPLSGWSRIQSLEIEGCLVYSEYGSLLAGLPRPSKDVRRVLRLRVASFLRTKVGLPIFLETLRRSPNTLGLDRMQDGSIFLVVSSEEEKLEVESVVSTMLENWRSLFVVELEN